MGYIGPFGPLPNFFGRTNHTNLTRRIDPRHPEPPNSSIPPKRAFSFFRFLGFRPEQVRFLCFRGERGSIFWASGEGGGSFSGFQKGEGVHFLGFRGRGTQSGGWPAAGGMHWPRAGECTGARSTTRSLKKPSKNPSRQAYLGNKKATSEHIHRKHKQLAGSVKHHLVAMPLSSPRDVF